MSLLLDDDSNYVDVTDQILGSLPPKLVQQPLFDLLEGTRAIEVTNARLDTGLIPLSDPDVHYDVLQTLEPAVIAAIQDKLIQSLMSWLNDSSLPITVLSCRYVQALIEHYMAHDPNASIQKRCNLGTNRILSVFIMGLCKFIDTCLTIGKSVLYEEEDMTLRSMNLDFLSDVAIDDVLAELTTTATSTSRLDTTDHLRKVLLKQLTLVLNLNRVTMVLLTLMEIFDPLVVNSLDLSFFSESVLLVDSLSKETHVEVPQHAFSRFIQVQCDNNIIPLDLYEIPRDDAYGKLRGFFSTVHRFVGASTGIKNVNQLNNMLEFDVQNQIAEFSVLARGIFQLFFVRDNSLVLGSSTTLHTLVYAEIDNLVGRGTAVLTQATPEVLELVGRLEQLGYHVISISAQNPCRQQQLTSRLLVQCDLLQVTCEALESLVVGDELVTGERAFAVSSFIYHTKLELMTRLALHGVELELYKDYEMYLVYWYAQYLMQVQIEHLEGRVLAIIDGKIHALTTKMQQQIKRLKDGPRKELAKTQYRHNLTVVVPALRRTKTYNSEYRVAYLRSMRSLTELVRLLLIVYSSFGLVDYTKGPRNLLTLFEHLYKLRLKPWSLIGVPDLPSYAQYKQSLDMAYLQRGKQSYEPLLALIEEQLGSARNELQNLAKSIELGPLAAEFVAGTSAPAWFRDMAKTCIAYTLEVKQMRKLVGGSTLENVKREWTLEVTKGYHGWFPIVKMARKAKSEEEK